MQDDYRPPWSVLQVLEHARKVKPHRLWVKVPILAPRHSRIGKYVFVVAPRRVGQKHSDPGHEAGDKRCT